MKQRLLAASVAVLLIACAIAAYLTRDTGSAPAAVRPATESIDDRLLKTARSLASQADTREEQEAAHEAIRLADHELDQAFATQLLVVTAANIPATGPLHDLSERVTRLKARVTADQQRAAQLTREADNNETAAEQLSLVKAQTALDQDELDDAREDLKRQGGDKHAKLQQAMQEHESAQHEAVQFPRLAEPDPNSSLSQTVQLWFVLRDRRRAVAAAHQDATRQASRLEKQHDALEKQVNGQTPSITDETAATSALIAQLSRLTDQRKLLTGLDRRIQDTQQLAGIYSGWDAILQQRERHTGHRAIVLLSWVLTVLFAVAAINLLVPRIFHTHHDRRRLLQLRAVASALVRVAGLLLILLILFGPPTQFSTMIGLATAGLTVVLKDFIVAFFGWFVLMGRNGIRVGDWIEIKGVGGEVIEIGLLRTVLLEVGNGTDTGHPTGRRVAFVNSFAIDGHYFNFSTAGQWLWDELQVAIPPTGDPYTLAQQILQSVERATESDAALAEQDWQRATSQYGMRAFSAKPSADLRPTGSGLTVLVRYLTRAPRRHEMKSRLLQEIVELLHKPAQAASLGSQS